jgi:hypothetical protein
VNVKDLGCRISDVPGIAELKVGPESELADAVGSITVQHLDGEVTVLTADEADELASALRYAANAARDIE